jgi:hypothetical protein
MIGPLFHVPDGHNVPPGNRRDRESGMSLRFGQ